MKFKVIKKKVKINEVKWDIICWCFYEENKNIRELGVVILNII